MTKFGWLCAMIGTPAQARALEQRQALRVEDEAAWLRSFDAYGRYHDPATGFWESLNSEMDPRAHLCRNLRFGDNV